jgi:hypothetical protein
MTQRKLAPEFSNKLVAAVVNSLPKPPCNRRLKMLPRILQEWSGTDLQMLLSMESAAIRRQRIKKLEIVKKRADQLLDALKEVKNRNILPLMVVAEGRRWEDLSRAEWTSRTIRLDEENDFLAKLSAIAPREMFKVRKGQPRNYRAYLFLQDAAAIFEWLTGTQATREVSRDDGTEIGPFFQFASTLWPIVFGHAPGLQAAMKIWASGRKRYGEQSPVMANIALRHPT